MNAATATAARFTAVRAEGRYRVQDTATGEYIATAASRAKAEERAAKLNAAEDREGTTLLERSADAHGTEGLTDEGRAALEGLAAAVTEEPAVEATTEPAPSEEESPSDARSDRAGELAAAVASGALTFDAAAAALLTEHPVTAAPEPRRALSVEERVQASIDAALAPQRASAAEGFTGARHAVCGAPALGSAPEHRCPECKAQAPAAPPAPRGRKVEPNTRALWVVVKLTPIICDSTDPAHASIVRKLKAATPNGQGGRTIRLTREEAVTLAEIATEIETAALDESVDVDGRGRLARSCVSMRNRAAALWD
jgi:hypothetical protein